jgi:EAL domain-containing protein (putative c-di-GMP-specific phosphodiesterase class I)
MNIAKIASGFRELPGGDKSVRLGAYEIASAFQPIYLIDDQAGTLFGLEALARPVRDERTILPMDFFAALPERAKMHADWTCLTLHLVNASAWGMSGMRLFVNMNPDTTTEIREIGANIDAIAAFAGEIGLAPERLVFEITECRAGSDAALAYVARKVRQLGCGLAIDDFGTSGSNLLRVVELEPDFVKMDRVWFKALMKQPRSNDLARLVLERLKAMGAEVIFEGVETPAELAWARAHGACLIQGHLFGAAHPVHAQPRTRVSAPDSGTETG